MDKQMKNDIVQVIDALIYCEANNKKCKKCKEKAECLLFIRSSLAVCFKLLLGSKGSLEMFS